jgi:hypothetical protein
MEPKDPIRERSVVLPPTDRRFVVVCSKGFADFVMCCLALVGLVGIAFVLMSFAGRIGNSSFTNATPMDAAGEIAKNAMRSAVGFGYMLWRYHWRFRLSTLLKIAVFWCAALASFAAFPTNVPYAGTAMFVFVFVYAVIWTSRPKGLPEKPQHDRGADARRQ